MNIYVSAPFVGNKGNMAKNLKLAQRATADLEAVGFDVVCPASQWHYRTPKLGRWMEKSRSYRRAVIMADLVCVLMHGTGTVQTAIDMNNARTTNTPVVFADFDRTVDEVTKWLEKAGMKYGKENLS